MLGRAAVDRTLLGLCLDFFSNKLGGDGDSTSDELMHGGRDSWHGVIVPDFQLLDSRTMQNLQNSFGILLSGEEIPRHEV